MNNFARSTIMVVRGTVGLCFEDATKPQKLRLQTDGGSIYSVDLTPGMVWTVPYDGATFTMRRGNVIINGRSHCDVLIGYCPATGSLLVQSSIDGHTIRQSTGITKD